MRGFLHVEGEKRKKNYERRGKRGGKKGGERITIQFNVYKHNISQKLYSDRSCSLQLGLKAPRFDSLVQMHTHVQCI